ncbi:MAG: alpha/beta hydrolase [Microcella sp.]|nr:alpha/beta hydrolase [Microcella sp.]
MSDGSTSRTGVQRFRRVMVIALASGILAFLIVPFLIPFESTGTLTASEAAGADAQFITVNDLEVHVVTADHTGESPAPPVIVLLHGFGASTFSWREVLQPLAEVGDVIAYDRAGFGFTQRPSDWTGENPYGTPGNLELLDALLADLAPDREVILVGHSAGGLIAAEYARLNPDVADRLVLIAPAVFTTGGVPAWLAPVLGLPQIDRLGPLLVQGIASSGEQLLEQSFVDQSVLTDVVREGYRAPLTVIGWEQGLWRFSTAPRDNELLANLATIEQPTLLITGDADTVVPTADTEQLATKLGDESNPPDLTVIAESGHLPHEERPEQFIAAVLSWIERTDR